MGNNSQKFSLTKNRITLIAVLAFAVALCCIFACAGNDSDIESVSSSASSAQVSEQESSFSSTSQVETLSGKGIYIDGSFVAAVDSSFDLESEFSEILSNRVAALGIDSSADVSFANELELVDGEYPVEAFVDVSSLVNVNDGSLSDYSGADLSVKLSVRSVVTYTENVVVEHEIKTVYTDALPDGATKVLSKGFDGEGEETHSVVSINGVETEHNVSLVVTSVPTAEVIRVGTRSNGKVTASLGTFIKPYDGYITSYVGPRWGRTHNGIDIVEYGGSCFRDPAVAAGDGVVITADWYGGYGKCVIIDHGNGIQTYYAHFDELCVSVGDVVSAGDVVGLIGSTGNSTGPHLHFEVRVNGEVMNPLLFVDYE